MDLLSLLGNLAIWGLVAIALVVLYQGIKIVPQSRIYIVERFGRFHAALQPGMSFIIPFFDRIAYRVTILEQQLPSFSISVITKDNVEIALDTTVFFRIDEPVKSVYSIANLAGAIETATASVVRSAAGNQDLDEIQTARETMNRQIHDYLSQAASNWGTKITRTEITDVRVDERTKESQRKQLDADRERRATIATAEGEKQSIQLRADADLYNAQKQAEAIRVTAEAEAHAVRVKAAADAEQTRLLAEAIANQGQPAIDFEIRKRQVQAIDHLAAARTTRTLILPAEVTGVLGGLETLMDGIRGGGSNGGSNGGNKTKRLNPGTIGGPGAATAAAD